MLIANRNGMAVPKPLDFSSMTQLEITATSQNLTYGIRKGVLASGSSSVRIYWDALGDVNDYTDYPGGFTDATHTYADTGDYVVAISDDISSLSVTGNSTSPAFVPNSRMLKKVTTGLKVTTMPSPGGGADEAMNFDRGSHSIEYINLRYVTSAGRPAWMTNTTGGMLIANNLTSISSYGLERSKQWNVYCDSLTDLNVTSTNGAQGMSFWFASKTCAQIMNLSNVLVTGLREKETLKFNGTDGYVYWDGSSWVQNTNSNGGGHKCVVILIICAVCSDLSRSRSPSRFSRPRQPSSEWRAAA